MRCESGESESLLKKEGGARVSNRVGKLGPLGVGLLFMESSLCRRWGTEAQSSEWMTCAVRSGSVKLEI